MDKTRKSMYVLKFLIRKSLLLSFSCMFVYGILYYCDTGLFGVVFLFGMLTQNIKLQLKIVSALCICLMGIT